MGKSLETIEKEKAEQRKKETQFKPGNKVRLGLVESVSSKPQLGPNVKKRSTSREGDRYVITKPFPTYGSSFEKRF